MRVHLCIGLAIGMALAACGGGTSKQNNTAGTGGDDTGGTGGTGGTSMATCGTTPAGFSLDAVGKTEGIVVAPDGTIYFSDFGPHVIRYAPPYDKPPEKTWATIAGAQILGVMYDPKRKL